MLEVRNALALLLLAFSTLASILLRRHENSNPIWTMLLSLRFQRFQQEPNTLLFGSKLGYQGVSTHYYSLIYLIEERAIIHVITPLIVEGGMITLLSSAKCQKRDDNRTVLPLDPTLTQ